MFVRVEICCSLNCGHFQLLNISLRVIHTEGGFQVRVVPAGGGDSPVWTAVFSELPQRDNKIVRVKSKTLNAIKQDRKTCY